MDKKKTIRDIAQALNLTPATVSRALNDSYQISPGTKAKVLALAREWNYEPNRIARGLRSNRTQMVGVLVPNIAYNFNSSALAGIEEILVPHGYRVIICQTGEKVQREIDNLKDLASIPVDGLIASLSAETTTIRHFKDILPDKTPRVFMDRVPDEPDQVKVMIDNGRAAFEAVRHLLRSGRRNIAWMAGPEGLPIADARYTGYCQAHEEMGLPADPGLKVYGPFDSRTGFEAMTRLLLQRPEIDAIFTINDRVAIEALAAVREAGKKVPAEVAVMGFNNEAFCPLLYPSLSTVLQPAQEMGREAARLLLQLMEGKEVGQQKTFVFETKILERGSTEPSPLCPSPEGEGD